MKNKGFTLIEIIVCLALLSTITISSIVIVNKKNSDNLKDINKKVSNAVDIYLNTKKDEDGDTYIEGINKGGQGLYINLKTLNDEGLIDKEIVNTLEKKENKKSEDLKILATKSISSTNTKECLGQIVYTFSWDKVSTPIYLCPKNTNETKCDENNSNNFSDLLLSKENIKELNNIDKSNYNISSAIDGNHHTSSTKENGIIKLKDDDKYYYRGNVKNNYAIFIKQFNDWYNIETQKYDYTKFDDNYLFRIVYFNDKEMKIISEKIKTFNDEKYNNISFEDKTSLIHSLNNFVFEKYFNDLFLENQNISINGNKYSPLQIVETKYFYYQTFCNNYVYYENLQFKYNNKCNSFQSRFGILSIDEAIIAGMLSLYIEKNCNNFSSSNCSDNISVNSNYISEGDGTIVWPLLINSIYNTDTKYYMYINGLSNNYEISSGKGNYGYFNKVPSADHIAIKNIRPTLLLNMNNLYIKSGSGLKTDPYVIDIKNNS